MRIDYSNYMSAKRLANKARARGEHFKADLYDMEAADSLEKYIKGINQQPTGGINLSDLSTANSTFERILNILIKICLGCVVIFMVFVAIAIIIAVVGAIIS